MIHHDLHFVNLLGWVAMLLFAWAVSYNRKSFPDKPFKAFVYSFDGEAAYCADAYTDKSQEAAEEIVIRDCEEHHAGSGKYSPCRIYSSE